MPQRAEVRSSWPRNDGATCAELEHVTQPPVFVGPPPLRPLEPRVHQPLHVVHLILSLLTFGFWLVIWGMAAMNASAANAQERERYEAEKEQYARDYDAWQFRYHQAYGGPPPPSPA